MGRTTTRRGAPAHFHMVRRRRWRNWKLSRPRRSGTTATLRKSPSRGRSAPVKWRSSSHHTLKSRSMHRVARSSHPGSPRGVSHRPTSHHSRRAHHWHAPWPPLHHAVRPRHSPTLTRSVRHLTLLPLRHLVHPCHLLLLLCAIALDLCALSIQKLFDLLPKTLVGQNHLLGDALSVAQRTCEGARF